MAGTNMSCIHVMMQLSVARDLMAIEKTLALPHDWATGGHTVT